MKINVECDRDRNKLCQIVFVQEKIDSLLVSSTNVCMHFLYLYPPYTLQSVNFARTIHPKTTLHQETPSIYKQRRVIISGCLPNQSTYAAQTHHLCLYLEMILNSSFSGSIRTSHLPDTIYMSNIQAISKMMWCLDVLICRQQDVIRFIDDIAVKTIWSDGAPPA